MREQDISQRNPVRASKPTIHFEIIESIWEERSKMYKEEFIGFDPTKSGIIQIRNNGKIVTIKISLSS